jgi:hypothetical protein
MPNSMSASSTAVIDCSPVSLREAIAIESAEMRAWVDMYGAAPAPFAEAARLDTAEIAGALVLRWAATGRRYFSRAIGLGVIEPSTPAAIDAVLDRFRAAEIEMFLLQSLPHCRPAGYEDWLRERGLEPFDAQDRIVRGAVPLDLAALRPPERELAVERVPARDADEWAEFLQRVYRLDTGPWLQLLLERARWHQYVAREAGRIVAARGMFVGRDGMAWLGMEGPVPGIMSDDYEPDAAICARIVADGLASGVRMFVADIEAPTAELDTPAYEHFGRLGFRRPYVRTHWAPS